MISLWFHSVFTMFSLWFHSVFTMFSLCFPRAFHVHSTCIPHVFTMFSTYIPRAFHVHSMCIPRVFTMFSWWKHNTSSMSPKRSSMPPQCLLIGSKGNCVENTMKTLLLSLENTTKQQPALVNQMGNQLSAQPVHDHASHVQPWKQCKQQVETRWSTTSIGGTIHDFNVKIKG